MEMSLGEIPKNKNLSKNVESPISSKETLFEVQEDENFDREGDIFGYEDGLGEGGEEEFVSFSPDDNAYGTPFDYENLLERGEYSLILEKTDGYKEPLAKARTEINKASHLRHNLQIYENPSRAEDDKEPFYLPADAASYKNAEWVIESGILDEKAIKEIESQDKKIVKDIWYGYYKSDKKNMYGRIKYAVLFWNKEAKRYDVEKIYFGSPEAARDFESQLEGRRDWTPEYKNLLGEVHNIVFDYLRRDSKAKEKLKEFGEGRGWHKEKVQEKIFQFIQKNDFGADQFFKYLDEYNFIHKDASRMIGGFDPDALKKAGIAKLIDLRNTSAGESQFFQLAKECLPEITITEEEFRDALEMVYKGVFDEIRFDEELWPKSVDENIKYKTIRDLRSDVIAKGSLEEVVGSLLPKKREDIFYAVFEEHKEKRADPKWRETEKIIRLREAIANFQYEDLAGLAYFVPEREKFEEDLKNAIENHPSFQALKENEDTGYLAPGGYAHAGEIPAGEDAFILGEEKFNWRQVLIDTNWMLEQFEGGKGDFTRQGEPSRTLNGWDDIRIPYFNPETGNPILFRRRILEEGAKNKYLHYNQKLDVDEETPLDGKMYGMGFSLSRAVEVGAEKMGIKRLIIIEGEFKAGICQIYAEEGDFFISIPGITEVTDEAVETIKKINASETIIMFDKDPLSKQLWRFDEKTDSGRAAYRIGARFVKAGLESVRAVDWSDYLNQAIESGLLNEKEAKKAKMKLGADDALIEFEKGEEIIAGALLKSKGVSYDYGYFLGADIRDEEKLKKIKEAPGYFDRVLEELGMRRAEVGRVLKGLFNKIARGGNMDLKNLRELIGYYRIIDETYRSYLKSNYAVSSMDQPNPGLSQIMKGNIPGAERKKVVNASGGEYRGAIWEGDSGTENDDESEDGDENRDRKARLAKEIIILPFTDFGFENRKGYHDGFFGGKETRKIKVDERTISDLKNLEPKDLVEDEKKQEPKKEKSKREIKIMEAFDTVRRGWEILSAGEKGKELSELDALEKIKKSSNEDVFAAIVAVRLAEDFDPKDFVFVQNLTLREEVDGVPKDIIVPVAVLDKVGKKINILAPVFMESREKIEEKAFRNFFNDAKGFFKGRTEGDEKF